MQVTVSNYGEGAASGSVTATAESWNVAPASAWFGPLANGESKTLEFNVAVPAGTAAGTYPVKVSVSSNLGSAKAAGSITVIGTHVEFTPGTDAEAPWLFDSDGSQLDGEVFDGNARFTDGGTHATYRFQLPADVQGGSLTLDIANQFLVETSTDNATWVTRLEDDRAGAGPRQPRGADARPQRAARRRPDGLRAPRRQPTHGRLGRLARPREARPPTGRRLTARPPTHYFVEARR